MKRLHYIYLLFMIWSLYSFSSAQTPIFKRQVVQVPPEYHNYYLWSRIWEDIDADGLTDLIMVSAAGTCIVYHQKNSGFPDTPTQRFKFPDSTFWFFLKDIDHDSKSELIISTSQGIFFYRPQLPMFNLAPLQLIEHEQFKDSADIIWVKSPLWMNDSFKDLLQKGIPIITPDKLLFYHTSQNDKPSSLTTYDISLDTKVFPEDGYMLNIGTQKLQMIDIYMDADRTAEDPQEVDIGTEFSFWNKEWLRVLESEDILEKDFIHIDINGDGHQDLLNWFLPRDIDPRTTFQIFLSAIDGKLPTKPDKILRLRGMPALFTYSPRFTISPFFDVNADGLLDIVLLEITNKPLSARSFLEMIASEGMQWTFTVRLLNPKGEFSNNPDFSMDIIAVLPFTMDFADVINLKGDFNGDGRPDLLVRRTLNRIEVFFSSKANGMFSRKPDLIFDVPPDAWQEIADFNHDSLSDLCLVDMVHNDIIIYLSQNYSTEGLVP